MKAFLRNSRLCFGFSLVVCFLVLGTASALAASIHGVVTNETTGKPAAGDPVALIRMQQGMEVAGRTTTDSQGRYTLDVADSDPVHLVRVTHQGASYFEAASSGKSTVDVKVYDVAEKVSGVTTDADLQWVEADGNDLQVMEIYVVKNTSSPPRTQFGPTPYEFYLPEGATILSAAALAPGSMPVRSAPKAIGNSGRYTFDFPIRPGETHFQVSYRLPYSGSLKLKPRFASKMENFAVILPKSMQFASTPASAFRAVDASPNVQTFLARDVTPGTRFAVRLSGTGQLPQQTDSSQSAAQSAPQSPEAAAQAEANDNTRPGIGLGVPLGTPSPLDKYKWWILSLVVVLLAAGAGIMMRQNRSPQPAAASAGADGATLPGGGAPTATAAVSANALDRPVRLAAGLREELFRLESDHVTGRITPEEYERQKSAIDTVLTRVLAHESAPKNGSEGAEPPISS